MEVLLEYLGKPAKTNKIGERKINDEHTSTKRKNKTKQSKTKKQKKTEREKLELKGNQREEMTKLWMMLKGLFSLEYSNR